MSRPAAVTAAAVVAIIGSLLALAMCVGFVYVSLSPTFMATMCARQPAAAAPRAFVVAGAGLIAAFAAWGIATAVGLLRLRTWARLSVVAFATLMTFGCLMALLTTIFIGSLPPQPGLSPDAVRAGRLIVAGTYVIPLAIGVWWLVQFNLPGTRSAFENANIGSPVSPRPLSMSVIGWIMIAGGIGCLFPVIAGLPGYFAAIPITGWAARAVYALLGGAELYAGMGLLRLHERGRLIAMAVCGLSLINALALVLVPGAEARLVALAQNQMPSVGTASGVAPHEPLMIGIWVGACALVPLWFLVRRKAAFQTA